MKRVIFILAVATASAMSLQAAVTPGTVLINADVKAAPPAAVLAAFTANFGNTPVRQWKLRSNGNWRAHFTWNGVAWEATFTPAGVLVKSERA